MIVEGTILRGREFTPVEGRVVVESGRINAIEETTVDSDAIVLPAFVNAHTHLGDSIAKDAGAGLTLPELVAPPDGLKHRILRTASRDRLIEGMTSSIRLMESTGTCAFVDFREGGIEGVSAIDEARRGYDIDAVILGREESDVLEHCDGFGASGAADGEFSAERRAAERVEKLFGIHAGEVDAGDINPALDLDPDFLVHLVAAEPVHLERIADSNTPVVVCPRSNAVTGVGTPPVAELVERTTVALGTDNVMLTGPSMFREMEFVEKIADVTPETVLRMATTNGAAIIGADYGSIEKGNAAKLLVLDGGSDNLVDSQDPVRSIVRRAGAADVDRVIL